MVVIIINIISGVVDKCLLTHRQSVNRWRFYCRSLCTSLRFRSADVPCWPVTSRPANPDPMTSNGHPCTVLCSFGSSPNRSGVEWQILLCTVANAGLEILRRKTTDHFVEYAVPCSCSPPKWGLWNINWALTRRRLTTPATRPDTDNIIVIQVCLYP